MKVLSLNAGYFLGYDGTMVDYVRHPLRAVKGDKFLTGQKVQNFSQLVESERPDAVLMQEVDQGSIRTFRNAEPEIFSTRLSEPFKAFAATKYSGILSSMPFTENMSNAVLTKKGEVKNHYLRSGRKSLVQELKIEGLSIFSVHLSRFREGVRKEQLEEISEIVSVRERFVVGGDFNFHREGEACKAEEILDADRSSPGKTFPTGDLSKGLDMAFSSGVDVECNSLDRSISDHRPVVIDVDI